MRKVFYHPQTLEIKGMSDGDVSMEFPFIETKENYHSAKHLKIEKDKDGKPKLFITKGVLDDEDFKEAGFKVKGGKSKTKKKKD